MAFVMQTSIHGRRLGISSSGGIVSGAGSSGNQSTAIGLAAQMWGDALVEASTGGTIRNAGITYISTAVGAAATFVLPAPVTGLRKDVVSISSSTLLTFEATGTGYTFESSAGHGSSSFALTGGAVGLQGGSVTFLGLSSTRWAVANVKVP